MLIKGGFSQVKQVDLEESAKVASLTRQCVFHASLQVSIGLCV